MTAMWLKAEKKPSVGHRGCVISDITPNSSCLHDTRRSAAAGAHETANRELPAAPLHSLHSVRRTALRGTSVCESERDTCSVISSDRCLTRRGRSRLGMQRVRRVSRRTSRPARLAPYLLSSCSAATGCFRHIPRGKENGAFLYRLRKESSARSRKVDRCRVSKSSRRRAPGLHSAKVVGVAKCRADSVQ